MWLLTFGLILSASLLIYRYFTRHFNYWQERNVPYIKPKPFVGNFGSVLMLQENIFVWVDKTYKTIKGDFLGIFVADQPHLLIKDPNIVKRILVKDFEHFQNRGNTTHKGFMKYFLFFSQSPSWKALRNKVSPVFTPRKLKILSSLIESESKNMVTYLEKISAEGEAAEVKNIAIKFSVNNIAKCVFGVDAHCFGQEDSEFQQIALESFNNKIFLNSARQTVVFFLPLVVKMFDIWFFNPTIINKMKNIIGTVFRKREQQSELVNHDIVDMLIEIKRKHGDQDGLSEDALLGHPIQFFFAGFETVSSTLSFTLYELAMDEDVQNRLRSNITETLDRHGQNITYESISDMEYVEMVLRESLRKYPALPFLDRRCNADYKIPNSDLVIEKGVPVLIPVMAFHYDEKYFPEAQKFIPERFSDMKQINRDGLYYVPFGEGPRICIGARFAELTLKIALVNIVSKFKIQKVDNTPVPMVFDEKGITLGSKFGIPLKFVSL